PGNGTRRRVERQEVRIEGPNEDFVPENRDATVHAPTATLHLTRNVTLMRPQRLTCFRIQRPNVSWGFGHEHRSVDNDGRGLDELRGVELFGPRERQASHIVCGDLSETAEAPAIVRPGVGKPVSRLALRLLQPLGGNDNRA